MSNRQKIDIENAYRAEFESASRNSDWVKPVNKLDKALDELDQLEESLGVDGHELHPKFKTTMVSETTASNSFSRGSL